MTGRIFWGKESIKCNGQSCLESSSTVKHCDGQEKVQSHQCNSILQLPWRRVSAQNKNCADIVIWLVQLSYPQLIIKLVMWFSALWGVNLFDLCGSCIEKYSKSLREQMIASHVVKSAVVLYWVKPSCHFNCSICANSVTHSVIAKTMCQVACIKWKNSYLKPPFYFFSPQPLQQLSCFYTLNLQCGNKMFYSMDTFN